MDAAAPGQARELYEKAGVTFVRGLDRADMLFETLDFEVVPNGFFVDENGIVRFAKFGGFEVRDDTDRSAIEALLAKPSSPVSAAEASTTTPAAAPSGPAGRWFRLGVQALENGDKKTAALHWRRALELDPANFVIRKQIWALEHPEQFYPAINAKWQRDQLAKERAQTK
jgi:hypothetical protein